MKIEGKTQSQRLLELMEEIVEKDGKITRGVALCGHYHLDSKLLIFLKEKGMIDRPTQRGPITWTTKAPNRDMSVLVAREFNKWVNERDKGRMPKIAPKIKKKKEEKIFVGYRLNIFGLKIRLRKPTLKVEKEYTPF